MGINLFPDKKACPFDCPYCEVFPFAANATFSLSQMEEELRSAIIAAQRQNVPVKDICFSGNGEPSLSPAFEQALKIASKIRKEMAASAKLVLITNGAGLLHKQIFSLLRLSAAGNGSPALDIWLKLDAGTQIWYQKMNRPSIPFETIIAKIKEFASCAPVTIQSMLCAIDGKSPPLEEEQEWLQLVLELAKPGNIRKVQLYGKARSAPEDPKASSLPPEYLEQRAASLRTVFSKNGITAPVEVYP